MENFQKCMVKDRSRKFKETFLGWVKHKAYDILLHSVQKSGPCNFTDVTFEEDGCHWQLVQKNVIGTLIGIPNVLHNLIT